MSAHVVDDAVRELARLRAANAALLDLLQRMHERLTDGRDVPEWLEGWVEEIDAAIQKVEKP